MLRRLLAHGSSTHVLGGNRLQLKSSLQRKYTSTLPTTFENVLGAKSVVPSSGLIFYDGGALGHLAEASAVCFHGGSVVHATVCSARNANPEDDFLPLTVDYRSRSYAFGRIPVNPNRRERHGTDDETLVSRVIDRAIRPLFPKGYVNEVQVTVTAHAAGLLFCCAISYRNDFIFTELNLSPVGADAPFAEHKLSFAECRFDSVYLYHT